MDYYAWPVSLVTAVFGRKKLEMDTEYQPPRDLEGSVEYVMLTILTDREYTAVKLKIKDKLNFDQIAEKMGISKSRVGQLVQNGLRQLKNPNASKYLYHGIQACMSENIDKNVKERFEIKYEKIFKILKDLHGEVEVLLGDEEPGSVKGMSIDKIEFSVGTYNGLKRAGIDTVGDIVRHENEIIHNRILNIGKIRQVEVASKMRDLGFTYFGSGNKDINWSLRNKK